MQKALGIFCIVCGVILLIIAVSPLILPLILLVLGLYSVNYGLQLLHRPTIWRGAQMWYFRRKF